MHFSTKQGLVRMLFALVLMLASSAGWAATKTVSCPTEPKQNVAIASGDTYTGSNCVLNNTGEVDSFVFNASAGDTWTVVLGVGNPEASDVCLAVNAPGGTRLYYGCTIFAGGVPSVAPTLTFATTGKYTLDVTEAVTGKTDYSLSLERINPAPGDAIAVKLSSNVSASVPSPTGQEAYTFYGATGSTYEVAVSYASGTDNLCFNVYQSGKTALPTSPLCTLYGGGVSTAIGYVTPGVTGTFVVLVYAEYDDYTAGYNLEISCYSGPCPNPPPPPGCTLKQGTPSYNASTQTLTMNFSLATPAAATWDAWLVIGNSVTPMWSLSEPYTEPAVPISKTYTVTAKSGKVGVLSTLTLPTTGIECSTFVVVNTGH